MTTWCYMRDEGAYLIEYTASRYGRDTDLTSSQLLIFVEL